MPSFSEFSLDDDVLAAVQAAGYEVPTQIQVQTIPSALEGRDVLGIAQTGTGKTAAFSLPMISLLKRGRARARLPRSLVITPTRELAAQIAENFVMYSAGSNLQMALLIGGVSFAEQLALIDRGVDVLIATPGRLLDHFGRGKLLLSGVQILVVDEADRMLDMGFIPDIERIFKLTPFTRQTLFFSATMAKEIERIADEFLSNPVRVEVTQRATVSSDINQAVFMFRPSSKSQDFKERRAVLRKILKEKDNEVTNGIIFCNRKVSVDILTKSMKIHGFECDAIHGDLEQSNRMKVLEAFRDGSIQFLVASDVASRGLDIPNVSHVFNFDVPIEPENYVHRIGRTGRAGRRGAALTICGPTEKARLTAIEELTEFDLPKTEIDVPPGHFSSQRQRKSRVKDKRELREESGTKAAVPTVGTQLEDIAAEKQSTEENLPPVVGMGEHVPDFLNRSFSKEASASE